MTHPTDFRALLQRIVNAIDAEPGDVPDLRENLVSAYRAAFDALAAPQQGAPSDGELDRFIIHWWSQYGKGFLPYSSDKALVRDALTRYTAQAVPVAVADVRYEFIVFDAETDEPQAGGEAPTLEEAQREGQHYFAMYSEDGPMRLELRRVEVLPLPEAQP